MCEQYRWFVGIDWAAESHEVMKYVFWMPLEVWSTEEPLSIPELVSQSWFSTWNN